MRWNFSDNDSVFQSRRSGDRQRALVVGESTQRTQPNIRLRAAGNFSAFVLVSTLMVASAAADVKTFDMLPRGGAPSIASDATDIGSLNERILAEYADAFRILAR